jgi:hypothetical protein
MNVATGFLGKILPEKGTYCVVGIKGDEDHKQLKQEFYDNIVSLADRAQELVDDKFNAYFAVASFKEGSTKRTQENAEYMKAFWLDLDCGEGKPYADQLQATSALGEFCKATNLPKPYIVNSGNGIHVYWLLVVQVTKEEWTPVARKLKAACEVYKLDADPAVTADEARILRIPNTLNFKNPEDPKEVLVQQEGEIVIFEDFAEKLNALDLPAEKIKPRIDMSGVNELTRKLMGNKQSRFSTIVRKSVSGNGGCNFIKEVVTNQENLEEPLWRAGLSIAWACVDNATAIHRMSSKHPDYSEAQTVEKASLTKGPYTCETIKGLAPELCKGCEQTCTSPIQLGSEIARAEEPEHVVPEADGSLNTQVVQTALFKPPWPYFRGKYGGVYREDIDSDGNKTEVQVYEHDLYVVERVDDPNDGECAIFRHDLPLDGVREFSVPLKDLHSPDKFKTIIGKHGVTGGLNQMKAIMDYSVRYIKELQASRKAHKARLHFGWNDGDKTFVVGHRAYEKNGEWKHNPASSATARVMHNFEPTGDLQTWRSIVNTYARSGMEELQFAIGCGFGAPLIKFTGIKGGTVNLVSMKSGTGKTTAGHIALSIFGDPDELMLVEDDKMLARIHRFGVMHSLPVMTDELTNTPDEELSDMIYNIGHGRGRERMQANANIERVNHTHWRTILLTSSNASITSKLHRLKARPDGELMRLIELHPKRLYVDGAPEIFAQLRTNYGVAGEVYAPFLVKNHNRLPEIVDKQKKRIQDSIGKRMEERFWVDIGSCVLSGLRAGQILGCHDIDLKNLEEWVCEELGDMRENVKSETSDASAMIGEFIMENSNAIVAVNEQDNVFQSARGPRTVCRFQQREGRMYISRKEFRDYCTKRQYSTAEVLERSKEVHCSYQYLGTVKKRLMSGTGVTAPPVDCLEFLASEEEQVAVLEAIRSGEVEP